MLINDRELRVGTSYRVELTAGGDMDSPVRIEFTAFLTSIRENSIDKTVSGWTSQWEYESRWSNGVMLGFDASAGVFWEEASTNINVALL